MPTPVVIDHKTLHKYILIQPANKCQFRNVFNKVKTESLQQSEVGGDFTHVYIFTRPYT